MVDGPKSPRAMSCMIPSHSAYTIESRGCNSPMDGRELRSVPSDDSSVFEGLDSSRNNPIMDGTMTKKNRIPRGGREKPLIHVEGAAAGPKYSGARRPVNNGYHAPKCATGETPRATDRFDSIEPSYSLESEGSAARRGFFRSLPAVADRDSYLSSSSSGSRSESSQNLEYNVKESYSYGGSMMDVGSDESSLAFITEVQVSSSSSEERITAMLAEHEMLMNRDLGIIEEGTDLQSGPSTDSYESIERKICNTNSAFSTASSQMSHVPKKARSEDDRKFATQSHYRKMQRVLQQARREVEMLKDNNEQFVSEIEQTEEEHESEMKLYEDRTKQKLNELRTMYLQELDLMTKEKDAAILEASRQSTQYAESGRKKIASLKRQLKKAKETNASVVYEAMSSVSNSSKRVRELDIAEETARIRQDYESKFKKFKADCSEQLKTSIEKAVNHNTKRILKEKNQEMEDSIFLIKQRVERETIMERKASSERYDKVNNALEEARKKLDVFEGEYEVIKQILEMVKENLVRHNSDKIKAFKKCQREQHDDEISVMSTLDYEKSVSKYHDIIGKSLVTEMGSAMQEVLTMYAFLLQSAEESQQSTAIKSQADTEYNKRVASDLKCQLDESKNRISKLQSDLEKGTNYQIELEKLRSERETMLKIEKERKELAVAMAAGQLELAYTMAAGREDIVSAMAPGTGEAIVPCNDGPLRKLRSAANGHLHRREVASELPTTERSSSSEVESVIKPTETTIRSAPSKEITRSSSDLSNSDSSRSSSPGTRRSPSDRFKSRSRSLVHKSKHESSPVQESEPYDCLGDEPARLEKKQVSPGRRISKQSPRSQPVKKQTPSKKQRSSPNSTSSGQTAPNSGSDKQQAESIPLSNKPASKRKDNAVSAPSTPQFNKSASKHKDTDVPTPFTPQANKPVSKDKDIADPAPFTPQANKPVSKLEDIAVPTPFTPQSSNKPVSKDKVIAVPTPSAPQSKKPASKHKDIDDPAPSAPEINPSSSETSTSSSKKASFRNSFKHFKKPKSSPQQCADIDSADQEVVENQKSPKVRQMREFFESFTQSDGKKKKRAPRRDSFTDVSASSLRAESGVSSPPQPPPAIVSIPKDEILKAVKTAEKQQKPKTAVPAREEKPARRPVLEASNAPNRAAPVVTNAKASKQTISPTRRSRSPFIKKKLPCSDLEDVNEPIIQTKRKSSLNMFANKRKASPVRDMPMSSVSEDQRNAKRKVEPSSLLKSTSDVTNETKRDSSPPSQRGARTIKLRKSWLYGRKDSPESSPVAGNQVLPVAKKTPIRERAVPPPSPVAGISRGTPVAGISRGNDVVNADDGLEDVPPLTSRQILKKRKPVVVDGQPQTPKDAVEIEGPDLAVSTKPETLSPGRSPGSLLARRKNQFVTPASTGHTLCLNPLSVTRPVERYQTIIQPSLSFESAGSDSMGIPPAPTSVSEEARDDDDDFEICDSASQMRQRAGYPSLGDKSDDEDEEDEEEEDHDEDEDSTESLVDKYATFSPVQFSDKQAKFEQSGSLRGKRITADGVAPSQGLPPIPNLDDEPREQTKHQQPHLNSSSLDSLSTPETPKRNPIFCRAGISAFSPPRSSSSVDPPSPAGSSEATTAVTGHTQRPGLRPFGRSRSSSMLPPRNKKDRRESSAPTAAPPQTSSKRSLGFRIRRHSSATNHS